MSLNLEEQSQQVQLPSGVALLMLKAIAEEHERPIAREVIEWYADAIDGVLEPDLGPRPRRGLLYRALGHLVDQGLIVTSVDGLDLTPAGETKADELKAAHRATFDQLHGLILTLRRSSPLAAL